MVMAMAKNGIGISIGLSAVGLVEKSILDLGPGKLRALSPHPTATLELQLLAVLIFRE